MGHVPLLTKCTMSLHNSYVSCFLNSRNSANVVVHFITSSYEYTTQSQNEGCNIAAFTSYIFVMHLRRHMTTVAPSVDQQDARCHCGYIRDRSQGVQWVRANPLFGNDPPSDFHENVGLQTYPRTIHMERRKAVSAELLSRLVCPS